MRAARLVHRDQRAAGLEFLLVVASVLLGDAHLHQRTQHPAGGRANGCTTNSAGQNASRDDGSDAWEQQRGGRTDQAADSGTRKGAAYRALSSFVRRLRSEL